MKIIGDILTKSWLIKNDALQSSCIDICIGFTKKEKLPVTFDNLSFGLSVFSENEKIFEESRPHAGSSYHSTDQECLDNFIIDNVNRGRKYTINVWAENAGEKWEKSFDVTMPRSESPYPSWSYDKIHGVWVSPVPYPDDDEIYFWDEDLTNWVKFKIN